MSAGRAARVVRPVVLALAVLVLGACGFHLRGGVALPPAMQYTRIVIGNPYSPLASDLRRALQASGVTVTENPDLATASLQILGESTNRRVVSVDAQGKAREFELQYKVEFVATGKGAQPLVKRQAVTLVREYLYDENEVLGTAGEEDVLLRDMRHDMVRLILTRLEASSSSAAAAGSAGG